MDKLEHILDNLEGVVAIKGGYQALCPAHDDHNPSLRIGRGDKQAVVMICESQGCRNEDIIANIPDVTWRDFMSGGDENGKRTTYTSRDQAGRVVSRVQRVGSGVEKDFYHELPDGTKGLDGRKTETLPLYNAQMVSAVPRSEPILYVEGQSCADAANGVGIPTVATHTGAKVTPTRESLAVLKDSTVVVWPDNDKPGLDHGHRIASVLKDMGIEVLWYEWEDAPPKGDVKDYIQNGGDVEKLKTDVRFAPKYVPPYDPMKDGSSSFEPDLSKLKDTLDAYRNSENGVLGIRTGIPALDRATKGLVGSHCYIFGAVTGSGKSVLVTQLALTAALQGHRTFLSMTEMQPEDYLIRMACYMAGVNYFKVRDGRATEEQNEAIAAKGQLIAEMPYFRDPAGALGTARLEKEIMRHNPEVVVVDYIQEVRTPSSHSREREVATVMDDLKELARRYNVAMIVAAQLNRDAYGREPDVNHIRESSAIGLAADDVWLLHRPDEGQDNEEMYLYCRKSRHGKKGNFPVWFVPGQNWITDQNPYGYKAPRSAQEGISF